MEAMAEEPRREGGALVVRLAREGEAVRVEVADRGAGIPEALAERLFDPFTSTKSQGMGMGLNICRSIVELHHGTLGHAPNPGGGTVFRILLPVAGAAAEGAAPDAPVAEAPPAEADPVAALAAAPGEDR
jgi:two-component system sensor histidine kinase DctS